MMRTTGGGWALARITVACLVVAVVPLVSTGRAAADGPSCTYNGLPSAVGTVAPGAVVTVLCTGLTPLQHVTITEESPLAAIVQPATSAPFEADASSVLAGTVDAAGELLASFTVPTTFAATDPAASCPPTQAQVDAGLASCTLAIRAADAPTSVIAAATIGYAGQPVAASSPVITVANGPSFVAGNIVILTGAGFDGSPGSAGPSVLFGATPAATNAASPISVSPATYVCLPDCNGTPGVLTAGGSLTGGVIVPSGRLGGPTTVTVVHGNVAATAQVNILGQPDVVATPSDGGTGTAVQVTGTGWDPQGPRPALRFLASNAPNDPASTATAYVDANGNLSGTMVVSDLDVRGVNPIVVTQGGLSAQAAFTVTDAISTCADSTCANDHVISQSIVQGELSISQQTFDISLGAETLNGAVQHSTGELTAVTVIDSRGTLVGWTVTGTLQGDFLNEATAGRSVNNSIPASNLSWTPTVALASPDSGALDQVAPGQASALSSTAGTTLCTAGTGGGGGSYLCTASLDLLIPGSVAVGTYTAVLNLTVT
jgi:hypothetical protein